MLSKKSRDAILFVAVLVGGEAVGFVLRFILHKLDPPIVVFMVALPTVAVAVAILAICAIREREKIRRWRAAGACLSCGYSLEGNVSGVCPECGTAVRGSGDSKGDKGAGIERP